MTRGLRHKPKHYVVTMKGGSRIDEVDWYRLSIKGLRKKNANLRDIL